MLKSKRKGFLLPVTLNNLYKDDFYSYFLFNILIILSFLISTWTAESVSNSSRKQRITFFNWLATPNEVKPSCGCSPWQSHETSHSRCEITDFHCLRKQESAVSTWTRPTDFNNLLLVSVCRLISLQHHLQDRQPFYASVLFKDLQLPLCYYNTETLLSGFWLQITHFAVTMSPLPHTASGLCEPPCGLLHRLLF